MTVYDWTAEGGADGTNVTVANSSSSGPALGAMVLNNVSTPGGGAGCIYSSTAASIGSLGVRITPVAGSTYMRWDVSGYTTATRAFVRRRYTHTATPGAAAAVTAIKNTSNGSMIEVQIDTSSRVHLLTAGGTDVASRYTLTVGTTYYIEAYATAGTTTANGRAELYVYAADGSTILNGAGAGYDTGAAANTGILAPMYYRMGGVTSTSGWAQDDVDGIRFGDLATGLVGPPANTAPTVSVGANQNVAAAATVTLTSSASDADGTIASRVWTFDYPTSGAPALTGGTTATATFTAGAAGSFYVLRHTVTDNGGLTAFATTEVRVPLSTTSVRHLPTDGTGVGTWSKIGGSATDGAALNDESAATYLESEAVTATAQTRRVRLAPMTARTALTLSETLWQDVAGTTTVKVRLYQGATLRQEWTQAITTTATVYTFPVTSPGAITDWGALFVELSATS